MKLINVTPEYLRQQGLSEDFPVRFYRKVRITRSCWIWIGCIVSTGYGQITAKSEKLIRAHRASWILHFGPIPKGLFVLHDCPGGDNPACVNPAHLWLGTQADNMQDCTGKGRRFPYKLTATQVRIIRKRFSPVEKNGASLARTFGVHRSMISHIIHKRYWK